MGEWDFLRPYRASKSAFMTHLRPLLMLLLALLALTSPSMAVGINVLAGSPTQVVASADDGIGGPAYRPCKQGGERVLPCHPDLGLLGATPARPVWTVLTTAVIITDPMPASRLPATDPPPPRSV